MTDSKNIVEELERRCRALSDGVEAVGAFIEGREDPRDGSPTHEDERVIGDGEPVATLRSQAHLQLEFVGDHVWAISKALSPPVNTMAALTLLRAVLEVSARTMWLLGPESGARGRVARSMCIRVSDVRAQMKLAPVPGERHPETRVADIHRQAEALGVAPLPGIPDFTSMAASELDAEPEYRFLSGLTHGSTSLIMESGLEVVRREQGKSAVTKAAKPLIVEFALIRSFEWIVRTMWRQASYLGCPHEDLRDVMNTAANDLRFPARLRFWNDSAHFVHWKH